MIWVANISAKPAVGFLLAAALVAKVLRRHRRLRRVDKQLRLPLLYMPLPPLRKWLLAPIRALTGSYRPEPVLPGHVRCSTFAVPAAGAVPEVKLLTFERKDRKTGGPAFLWMHGGGLVAGNAAADAELLARMAHELDILVVSVGYRLAPEHTFPAAIDDCFAAFEWVYAQHERLGIDPERIALGGTSAGGGLAAALAQRAFDNSACRPAFQLLVYPMLDDRTSLKADHEGRGEILWTPSHNLAAWTAYLGRVPDVEAESPYAAAARRENLAGLPPAWVGVGTLDLFYAENVAYARRLAEAGVPCELEVVPAAYHGFDVLAPTARASMQFTAQMMEALRRGLGAEAVATGLQDSASPFVKSPVRLSHSR